MKKLLLSFLAVVLATVGVAAHAVTATGTFAVGITLSSACEVATVPTIAFAYTSFQTGAATSNSTFTIRCTNTKTITSVLLDNGLGGLATGLSQSYTDQATGLAYSLTLSGVPTAGTGAAQTINIAGSMAADQSGTCAGASCANTTSTNRTRTITITY
jgi:spore coat protein U-like protein